MKEEIKEAAIQLTNVVIAAAAEEDLTGEEKEAKVCDFLATLDNSIPGANFIPDSLEAKILDIGIDKLQEFFKDDIKPFIKKCYERIKHLFKK